MSFSLEEKQRAQTITYNVKNYIYGDVTGSQVGTVASNQSILDVTKLTEFIAVLKDRMQQLGLDENSEAEVKAEIQTLEAQAASPKPKTGIVRESLATIRSVIEGITGNLAAAAILNHLPKF